jgi:hypothetical protein
MSNLRRVLAALVVVGSLAGSTVSARSERPRARQPEPVVLMEAEFSTLALVRRTHLAVLSNGFVTLATRQEPLSDRVDPVPPEVEFLQVPIESVEALRQDLLEAGAAKLRGFQKDSGAQSASSELTQVTFFQPLGRGPVHARLFEGISLANSFSFRRPVDPDVLEIRRILREFIEEISE